MKNNKKEINPSNAMIDIAYQVLFQNKEPMIIQELIKKVFEIKQMDINNKDVCCRLYVDIVTSGLFIFCGNDLWNIKANNLHFLDQEYFNENDKLSPEIDKEILNFQDFDVKKDQNKDNEDEKEELDEDKLDSLDISLDNSDDNDDKLEEEFEHVNKSKEEDENEEEEYMGRYDDDYFYK